MTTTDHLRQLHSELEVMINADTLDFFKYTQTREAFIQALYDAAPALLDVVEKAKTVYATWNAITHSVGDVDDAVVKMEEALAKLDEVNRA